MATKKATKPAVKKTAAPAAPAAKPKTFKRGALVTIARRDGTAVTGVFVSHEDKVNGRWMTVNLSEIKGKPKHVVARASAVTAAG